MTEHELWLRLALDARGLFDGSPTRLYFIEEAETGRVKIGVAGRPEARLATLQQANPRKLALLVHCPGTVALEHYLHRMLASSRLAGEWFLPSPLLHMLVDTFASVAEQCADLAQCGDEATIGSVQAILESPLDWIADHEEWRAFVAGEQPESIKIGERLIATRPLRLRREAIEAHRELGTITAEVAAYHLDAAA